MLAEYDNPGCMFTHGMLYMYYCSMVWYAYSGVSSATKGGHTDGAKRECRNTCCISSNVGWLSLAAKKGGHTDGAKRECRNTCCISSNVGFKACKNLPRSCVCSKVLEARMQIHLLCQALISVPSTEFTFQRRFRSNNLGQLLVASTRGEGVGSFLVGMLCTAMCCRELCKVRGCRGFSASETCHVINKQKQTNTPKQQGKNKQIHPNNKAKTNKYTQTTRQKQTNIPKQHPSLFQGPNKKKDRDTQTTLAPTPKEGPNKQSHTKRSIQLLHGIPAQQHPKTPLTTMKSRKTEKMETKTPKNPMHHHLGIFSAR